MSPLRILLVDDHALVRAGLRSLLQDIEGVEIVAEAGDGLAAVAFAQQHSPDVVIMDIAMRELNGLDATAHIKRERPDIQVLILSMHNTKEYVLQALRAGASGYLLKDSAPAELELALRAVRRGETYLSPAVSKQMIAHVVVSQEQKSAPPLTPRQGQVLLLIAQGHSTKAIAHRLHVSVKTVETHRTQLMARLGISDIAGLVRYAIRSGIIDAGP